MKFILTLIVSTFAMTRANIYVTKRSPGLQIWRILNSYNAYFFTKSYARPLLESSHRDDSNKWSNIGFCGEITQVESIEVNFTHLILELCFSLALM